MLQNYLIKFLVISLLLFCPLFAFSKKASHPYQNELLVIGALKNLYTQQAAYLKSAGNGNFGTFNDLYTVNLIDANLATGEKYGYYFHLIKTDRSASGIMAIFSVSARPKVYGKTGKRSFYMDNRCVVHGANKKGESATENDPVIETCTPTIAYEFDKLTIEGLRKLVVAQEIYKTTVGNGNYGNTGQLFGAGLIDGVLPHNFLLQIFEQSATEPAKFKAWRTPLFYRQNGMRSFYVDSTGILRGADHQGGQASENDPIILEGRTAKQKNEFKD